MSRLVCAACRSALSTGNFFLNIGGKRVKKLLLYNIEITATLTEGIVAVKIGHDSLVIRDRELHFESHFKFESRAN